MPPPKDPIKYAEYIKRQSESHIGHPSPRKGKKHSEETIEKMRKAKIGMYDGSKNPFYGKTHTQETLNKIREKALNPTEESRKKMRNARLGKPSWNKGITVPEHIKAKLRESQKGEKSARFGKHHSETAKQKIRESRLGKTFTDEHCKKISESRIGKGKGERNANWNGGTSFAPYCNKFDERRKKAVRRFFKDICICCGKHVTENIVKTFGQIEHSVHHIDHDKEQGCGGKNFQLVPLCIECHTKELHRQQEYKDYINKTLDSGFEWGIWSKERYAAEVMYN